MISNFIETPPTLSATCIAGYWEDGDCGGNPPATVTGGGQMARKERPPAERSYGRLTRSERNDIERGLDRGDSCREIARSLGRAPSTVANEVARHRFVTPPRSMRGLPAPEGLGESCPRLASWPRCCNGCRRRRAYGCNRRPRAFYDARLAQARADAELVELCFVNSF